MPRTFVVGGFIRDKILGINSKDIDYTFVLDNLDQTVEQGFEEMTNYMKTERFEIFLTTPDCFTIRARFPKGSKNEKLVADFVMARKEIGYYEGTRRPKLALGTLADDLERRDFTLNALAIDDDGNIIDLFNGQEDLKNRILKTPLDANITFMDDPLRILRALRFSITKGFTMHPTLWKAMENPEILNKLFSVVSTERIREELFKMMRKDTIASLRLLIEADSVIPKCEGKSFIDIVFKQKNQTGLWLKPTFENQEE